MTTLTRLTFRFATALILTSLGLATLHANDDVLNPHDVAVMQYVLSTSISPDGDHVAYVRVVPRDLRKESNGGSWTELHVVDAEGNSRAFVTGKVNVSAVGWTPDGRSISFLAKRHDDKHTSLYQIPIDGGEARRLLAHDTSIAAYAFRPDGKKLAFLAKPQEASERKKLREQGFDAEIYEENLVNTQVWIADASFTSEEKPVALELPGSASEIEWSPNGRQLAIALAPTPLVDDYYMYRRWSIVDATTGKVLTKIKNPGKIGPLRWSPDGSRIAFCSGEDIHDPSEGRLMVASTKTGEFSELMPDYLPNVVGIEWKDNQSILFLADDGCYTSYGAVALADGKPKFMVEASGPILTGFTLSDDKQTAAFSASLPTHPGEVYAGRGRNLRRLTNSNPWLDDKRLAKQEVVRYQARDGEMIEGVLIHPLNAQKGKRYPLILTVHGGPESQVPNGWVTRYSYPGQVAAARGFAVFYPNYRGSTGRGVYFAKAHQSDYGGREFNDLIDGIDHLVEMGLVDKAKVGVTGGSYGGFASAWCATYHTKRFAASVMFVGISNQISKSGTTDIPDEMYLVHARKRLWEDWQFFLTRSPIYYAKQAETPILILHGKNDPRVHPSQSLELYRNLKILDKAPVRLVLYPGEGHGNRKAAGRLDYNLRCLRWMEYYLQGKGGDPPPNQIDYGLSAEADK